MDGATAAARRRGDRPSRGENATSGVFTRAAEGLLDGLPAEAETPSRLAAALIRVALARSASDIGAAAAAADSAELLVDAVPRHQLVQRPWNRAQVLAGRGAVELWSGRFDEAAAVFASGVITGQSSESATGRADFLGHLALIEALQGRLSRAEELAGESASRPADGRRPAGERMRRRGRGGARLGARGPERTAVRPPLAQAGRGRPAGPAGQADRRAWPASSRPGTAWRRAAAGQFWTS